MDYVSSVYPRWVEEVALYKERKRIIGDQASLRADLTTSTSTNITTGTSTATSAKTTDGQGTYVCTYPWMQTLAVT